MDRRKVIAQLRAKATSTTFPEEAASLRAKADKLEAKYFPHEETRVPRPRVRQINIEENMRQTQRPTGFVFTGGVNTTGTFNQGDAWVTWTVNT